MDVRVKEGEGGGFGLPVMGRRERGDEFFPRLSPGWLRLAAPACCGGHRPASAPRGGRRRHRGLAVRRVAVRAPAGTENTQGADEGVITTK